MVRVTKEGCGSSASKIALHAFGHESEILEIRDPVLLKEDQINELLDLLPPRAFQARRFVQLVGANPDSPTSECNRIVAGVNLSDIARKYNVYLEYGGYKLDCRLPDRLIKNKYGEPTMQHLWGLYETDRAA